MITKNKVLQLISKSVGEKVDILSTSSKIEKWDSLAHLHILSSLDKLTNGKSSKIDSLSSANSVKIILNILDKNKLIKK